MVKKKKIIKRLTALGVVALLLLVAIAPAILPSADALPALPGGDYEGGNFVSADVAYLLMPLDRFTFDTDKVSLENPFYSLALGDRIDGYSSSIDYKLYNYGGEPVWEFWKLGVNDTGNGFHTVLFGIGDLAVSNGTRITFSNSSQFVAKIEDLNTFLNYTDFEVPQFYEYTATVKISGYYPYLAENKSWSLKSFSVSYLLSDKNIASGVMRCGLPQIIPATISDQLGDGSMLIVDKVSITANWYVSLEDLNMNGASPLNFMRFSMPVSEVGLEYDFSDFWSQYPCHVELLDGEPGSMNFDLGVFLSQSIGSFFRTEIIPGLSFGILLSVAIGTSLVCIFLKKL